MEREYDDFLIGPQSDEFVPDHYERDSDILDEWDDDDRPTDGDWDDRDPDDDEDNDDSDNDDSDNDDGDHDPDDWD